MKSKTGTFVKVFISLLVAVILVGVIGFIMYFSNNLTTDLATFYVQYGSREYRRDTNGLKLETGVYHNFECKYILGFPSSETGERYSVKIVPNDTSEEIEYKVDGYRSSYYPNDKLEFSNAFTIVKNIDGFMLFIPVDLTMQTVLNGAYEGKAVTNVPQVDLTANDYFRLIVSSYDGKTEINISFRLAEVTK